MATEVSKKKHPMIRSDIRFGSGMDVDSLRAMAEANPETFMDRCQEFIDKGELKWQDVRSLPRLFHALADVQVKAHFEFAGQTRAVMASAFPLLAGGMTIAGLNAEYETVPTIGQELVTEAEDSKKVSIYAATTSEDVQIDRVDESKDFPEIGAGEEKYEIRSLRNGRRLSITAETIEENNVAGIVDRINKLAQISSNWVEKQTLRRVCDIDGSATTPAEPYVLRPNGAGTPLYVTSAAVLTRCGASGNRKTNNALADHTDLEAARLLLTAMTDSLGERVYIPMSSCTLLVPDALLAEAMQILNSEMISGTLNEWSSWGPRGAFRPRLLSSPRLDDLSTTVWYLGDFAKQFVRKWKLNFEYVTLAGDTESFLRARIAFQARIAWDVEIGARDYVYVVQNLSATTAP